MKSFGKIKTFPMAMLVSEKCNILVLPRVSESILEKNILRKNKTGKIDHQCVNILVLKY